MWEHLYLPTVTHYGEHCCFAIVEVVGSECDMRAAKWKDAYLPCPSMTLHWEKIFQIIMQYIRQSPSIITI